MFVAPRSARNLPRFDKPEMLIEVATGIPGEQVTISTDISDSHFELEMRTRADQDQ